MFKLLLLTPGENNNIFNPLLLCQDYPQVWVQTFNIEEKWNTFDSAVQCQMVSEVVQPVSKLEWGGTNATQILVPKIIIILQILLCIHILNSFNFVSQKGIKEYPMMLHQACVNPFNREFHSPLYKLMPLGCIDSNRVKSCWSLYTNWIH